MHIQNLSFNCQGGGSQPSGDIEGCMGWQNLYAEEAQDLGSPCSKPAATNLEV
jgi:hypothetical protein